MGMTHYSETGTTMYEEDCKRGRELAEKLVAKMQETGDVLLLNQVAKSMVERGQWTGVEVGFFTVIAILVV